MNREAARIGTGLLALAMLLPRAQASPARMMTVPGARIQPGVDMAEVVRASAECMTRQDNRDGEACAPERFQDELSRGPRAMVRRFRIDQLEVSVGDYAFCVKSGRCAGVNDPRRIERFRAKELPMTFVTFSEAKTYCAFVDKRLPTEVEFELASRGATARRYPWGDLYHHGRANSGRAGSRVTDRRDGYELLAPSRSFEEGKTPQGVLHLAGNAAEWVDSGYAPHGDREATKKSSLVVVKGGSFMLSPVHSRGSARQGELRGARRPDLGFRCAQSVLPREWVSKTDSDPR